MTATVVPLVQIDGKRPTSAELVHPALANYGHFTAMQVRRGAVRGLDNHLARLRDAHAELFNSELDIQDIRALMRHAVDRQPDAYLRVTLYESEPGVPRVMTALRPAIEPGTAPQSLLPVSYIRPFPHIKHVGTFPQIRYGLQAEQAGYDDALLVTADGRVAETTIANIGFFDGRSVVWPDAPSLRGITWQLLDAALTARRRDVRSEVIRLESVGQFDGAFLANSVGITAVGRLGQHEYNVGGEFVRELTDIYTSVPWDVI